MPKGEHFKKDNPRIHQVSFKVNKTELEKLQKVVADAGMSIPEWIRGQINNPSSATSNTTTTKPKKAKSKPIAKPEPDQLDSGVHKGEQTTLF